MEALPNYALIPLFTTVSILLIVQDDRLAVEQRLRQTYGIDRDWWIPPIAFAVAVALSVVEPDAIRTAFVEKFDIIILIFSFGIMSEGLGESGFFRYIAYRVVDRCKGDSARLVLYMFTVTSIVTFFTTNDVVVLVMTPIMVEVCFQAGLKNTKLILLSQFIAANTLSMGLLIGSPTNIIIAEELGLGFFSYLGLMFFPAVVAFGASLVLIDRMIRVSKNRTIPVLPDIGFQDQYSMPKKNPEPYFTTHMRNWILIFATFVALVAVVTYAGLSLYWCAIPSIVIALAYWSQSDNHQQPLREALNDLPYGIFFFGMTFFIFAQAFSNTSFMQGVLVPWLQQLFAESPVRASVFGVFGSGMLVNVFNDLPAAAIVSKVLVDINIESFLTRTVLVQGSLVGLNIGTYVTQIGALAGLIWFNQIRVHRQRHAEEFPELATQMRFPNRIDLVKFGLFHFVFAGLVAAVFILFEWVFISHLISPWSL